MNSVPTYIEKTYIHPNGSTFKVLETTSSNKKFYIEYPSNVEISSNRLILSQIKSGLTPSYTYKLEITGVGFRAWIEGKNLLLNVGKAVPQIIEIPKDIKVEIKKNGVEIEVTGLWKNEVSLFASQIRAFKPSHKDRYKQKGIKFISS